MNIKMAIEVSDRLIQEIKHFLNDQAECRANGTHGLHGPSAIVLDAFRESFQSGGLDCVDELIEAINNSIKQNNGVEGLGEGASLEQSDNGGSLHIFFVNFETEKVLARASIRLSPATNNLSPD